MSTDTSVPRQRDASEAALSDLLMLHAPVGLAVFGTDLRVSKVNQAFARAVTAAGGLPGSARDTGVRDPGVLGQPQPQMQPQIQPQAEPAAFAGLLPGEI